VMGGKTITAPKDYAGLGEESGLFY
jgi:hypothetical protein